MRLNSSFRRVLVAMTTLIAACHDSTAPVLPSISFDAAHARARVEPLAKIFDQPIFASFQGAMSSFEGYFRSGGSIPENVKGKTFVFDAASRTYVVDPTAGGVPAGEVRFVLYVWDGSAGRPATPLTRAGYVDLADVSTGVTAPRLVEIYVVREIGGRAVVADFVVMHNVVNGVNVFGIEGSATDAFTVGLIELNGTETGAAGEHHLVYNTNLSTSPSDVSAAERLISDQATGSQGGRLALAYDGHTFSDVSVGNGTELEFDGKLYARVLFPTNPQEQTRYVRPDGSPLPPDEIANVAALLERAVVANFFWINLAWP
jgi:hypothetical protein